VSRNTVKAFQFRSLRKDINRTTCQYFAFSKRNKTEIDPLPRRRPIPSHSRFQSAAFRATSDRSSSTCKELPAARVARGDDMSFCACAHFSEAEGAGSAKPIFSKEHHLQGACTNRYLLPTSLRHASTPPPITKSARRSFRAARLLPQSDFRLCQGQCRVKLCITTDRNIYPTFRAHSRFDESLSQREGESTLLPAGRRQFGGCRGRIYASPICLGLLCG